MTLRLWLLFEDPDWSELRSPLRGTGRVLNGLDIGEAITTFNASLPGDGPWSDPYPANFPVPRVSLDKRRLPDWNVVQNLPFVSDRLRRAMALPEGVAQFLRVANESRTPDARAVDYSFLNVRAFARAIDPGGSNGRVERYASAKTGEECFELVGLSGIRFVPGFTPPADLFRDSIEPTILLATDALAQRVIDAGCTGLQFRHPLWFAPGFKHVVRTSEGAARVVWDTNYRSHKLEPMPVEAADAGPQSELA